uniref:HVA22-like protein n=1 Tax=Alexandrium andersonii TaxID=327968 RepID=A0A7S2AEQ7_9DINO|mmetsp:Transcript_10347/g.23569  ORF Transcript_10347/g.23569 Transcript_10347/m.23569 type:complete len:148 (+) Transcript_10347:118-561(+)
MVISILPFPQTLVAFAQFGYPLVCYLEKAKSGATLRDLDYVQWTMYWVICAVWMFLEWNLLFFLVDYFPLYLELKLVVLTWLLHPEYLGAAYLWYGKLQKLHKPLDEGHYSKIIGAMEKAKVPEAAKSKPVEASNKEEVIEDMLKSK